MKTGKKFPAIWLYEHEIISRLHEHSLQFTTKAVPGRATVTAMKKDMQFSLLKTCETV
jgi:hypothetical protein